MSQVVEMYISGMDKLGYINGDLPQPSEINPSFLRWRIENVIVKEWLINSMEASLINNFIRFSTPNRFETRLLLHTLMNLTHHRFITFDNGYLECGKVVDPQKKYYTDLPRLLCEIYFCRPNPMDCAVYIQKYNSLLQDERFYIFLDDLDDRLDHIRSDVLQFKPFPVIEQAYAYV